MEVLGSFINGNFQTTIYNDGTKIRENDLDCFIPDRPECLDISLSEYCENDCGYCYLGCSKEGRHGDILNNPAINSLLPFTEVAFNINSEPHPDLIPWLQDLRQRDIIPNATIAQSDFMKEPERYLALMEHEGIFGLGISLTDSSDTEFLQLAARNKNIVIHVIAGIVTMEDLFNLSRQHLKVLILGYKSKGRGLEYENAEVKERIDFLKINLRNILKFPFEVVSFDNLALSQLRVKDQIPKEIWDLVYMGDDGQFTMYLDLVHQTYGPSSTSDVRIPIEGTIKDMFQIIRRM